jgi:REP element-mobilizing transposase RayT
MVHIKQIRLKQYDYKTDGYYFVTAVCDKRNNFLSGKEKEIKQELIDLQNKTTGLKLDYFVTMPNHVHIIFILQNSQLALGEIVRRFKAKVSHAFGQNIWQPNYYEDVIRTESALEKIREYIINNPQELLLKFEQFYL